MPRFSKKESRLLNSRIDEEAENPVPDTFGDRPIASPSKTKAPIQHTAIGNGFFRIDRRTWAAVCGLGMNPAVAYLALACGSGRDNRTTAWSAQAVAKYAGIAWVRADVAVKKLIKAGFLTQTKTNTRPCYELLEWPEVEKARPLIDDYQREVFEKITRGHRPQGNSQHLAAEALVEARWLCKAGDGYTVAPADDGPPSEHYIWLPNPLLTGTDAGEVSPVARLRRIGDVLTLRLLVDLYQAHHLRDDGGINRAVICQDYERTLIGAQGIYVIWGFVREKTRRVYQHRITNPHWVPDSDGELMFWKRWKHLEEQGLVEWVSHLCESQKPDAEIIHPCGADWGVKGLINPENRVGRAAHYAGIEMGYRMGKTAAVNAVVGTVVFGRRGTVVPVLRDYPDVAMTDIARLRYRPHTQRTAQWWAKNQQELPRLIKQYEQMMESASQVRHQR